MSSPVASIAADAATSIVASSAAAGSRGPLALLWRSLVTNKDFLSVVKGFQHGLWYGAKVRFPHALVMTFLFRSGTLQDKLRDILNATYQHSRNLALYVAIYKFTVCVLRHLRGGVDSPVNSLIGGFIGGAIMFGSHTPINAQINMYIMSRVILGSVKALSHHGYLPSAQSVPHVYTLYAATCWALVMYLFEYQEKHIQKSLATSMNYLYKESDQFPKINRNVGVIDWFLG